MEKQVLTIWHSKDEVPVYVEGLDNRLVSCAKLPNLERMNVCYLEIRRDGRIIGCNETFHSEKWLNRNAMEWKYLRCDWWAYVRDIIPAQ